MTTGIIEMKCPNCRKVVEVDLSLRRGAVKYRIIRDVIFIVLGITFLVISIFVSYSDSKKENNNTGKKTTTVVDKLKEINKDKKTK